MSKLKKYLKGETIAAEGEKARGLFILVDGKIGIFKGGKKVAEFDKEGTIVGEMSLILKKERTASIVALEDSKLLAVEGQIDDIIKLYPDITKKILVSLAERLAKSTENI
ncbi:cyclic nucleotide-binding protein [Melioribacter roseus P3M-2]|jgi:CRP-like cAMP-binding protein|uniref:Cyclic nucleotide-binding protein n=1 Tax=Melioribacter roseus (strain DSM 23840 / JCM 17771 / VKM B-2668 / P3M-2) TaxID=1191523 RepID=I6YX82_MELRP|nr:cyclic nucleotide-binding domain-containing protein [Melioribacter roseus]AFN75202.1 cyclic nucleotide-binding protein [Melioribacter roseus P3M-2]